MMKKSNTATFYHKFDTRLFDTPAAGPEGAPPAAPQSMLGGNPPAAAAPPATPPAGGGGNPPAPSPAGSSWISSLPKELQENPSLTKFTSVEALAGSYLNATKMLGADKIAVPTKHTTPEEFRAILHKIGLPAEAKDYTVKFKDGVTLEEEVSKGFQEFAYKQGILPAQAQAIADYLSDASTKAVTSYTAKADADFKANVATLQKEWGNAFELNIARANKALKELGGDEIVKHFNDKGFGGDANVMRVLAKAGELLYAEHQFVPGQGTPSGMTPAEIDKKIAEIYSNPGYMDKAHPQHKALVEEAKSLFELKNPVDKQK